MQVQQRKKIITNSVQGAASMGRTYAILGGIIFIALGLFFVIIGSLLHSDPYTIKVNGIVIQKECKEIISSLQYNCNLLLKYKIQNKTFTKTIKNYMSYSSIHIGDEIVLYVNPKKLQNAKYNKSPEWLNILLIIIGILFILFSSIYMYYICKYKGLAILSGLKKVVFNN
jgi:hypothetical protein